MTPFDELDHSLGGVRWSTPQQRYVSLNPIISKLFKKHPSQHRTVSQLYKKNYTPAVLQNQLVFSSLDSYTQMPRKL
jgi:hypothetical protein